METLQTHPFVLKQVNPKKEAKTVGDGDPLEFQNILDPQVEEVEAEGQAGKKIETALMPGKLTGKAAVNANMLNAPLVAEKLHIRFKHPEVEANAQKNIAMKGDPSSKLAAEKAEALKNVLSKLDPQMLTMIKQNEASVDVPDAAPVAIPVAVLEKQSLAEVKLQKDPPQLLGKDGKPLVVSSVESEKNPQVDLEKKLFFKDQKEAHANKTQGKNESASVAMNNQLAKSTSSRTMEHALEFEPKMTAKIFSEKDGFTEPKKNASPIFADQKIAGPLIEQNTLNTAVVNPLSSSPLNVGTQIAKSENVTLEKLDSSNAKEIMNQVRNHIIQMSEAGKDHAELTVNSSELGQFKIEVTRPQGRNQELAITIDTRDLRGHEILSANRSDLITHLENAGLKIGEVRIQGPTLSTSAGLDLGTGRERSSSSQSSFAESQNSSYNSKQENQQADSQRRRELWENAKRARS